MLLKTTLPPGRVSINNLYCRSIQDCLPIELPTPFCSGGSFGGSSTARLPSASRLPCPGALSGHCRNVVTTSAMLSWSCDYSFLQVSCFLRQYGNSPPSISNFEYVAVEVNIAYFSHHSCVFSFLLLAKAFPCSGSTYNSNPTSTCCLKFTFQSASILQRHNKYPSLLHII